MMRVSSCFHSGYFTPEEKWFAKMDDFKQLKISLFAYWPTRKLAYFGYKSSPIVLLSPFLICYWYEMACKW